jgi:hypothetical protein
LCRNVKKKKKKTQKVHLNKKYSFGKKKTKSVFKGLKNLKIAKMLFRQKFKNEVFAKKTLFDLKILFFKRNLKQILHFRLLVL